MKLRIGLHNWLIDLEGHEVPGSPRFFCLGLSIGNQQYLLTGKPSKILEELLPVVGTGNHDVLLHLPQKIQLHNSFAELDYGVQWFVDFRGDLITGRPVVTPEPHQVVRKWMSGWREPKDWRETFEQQYLGKF